MSGPKYLGHLNINVRDVEISHEWYSDLLGLHTYDFIPGRAAFLIGERGAFSRDRADPGGRGRAGASAGTGGIRALRMAGRNLG